LPSLTTIQAVLKEIGFELVAIRTFVGLVAAFAAARTDPAVVLGGD
jgi:hypothetical protein